MKLTALRLHNVKRFGGHGVAIEGIGDGVNVLTAANEFGKSTAFEALHALFFQPHTSVAGPIKLLRPYSGGNPLVEADILTVEGQFRLTKQFHGGKRAEVRDLSSGRLLRQADEAEAFIRELTRGGSAGPAGLLWVRQGVTGIERQSNTEQESDKRVRETLLSSVQGEVEALTGGRRMAEIVAACEEELAKLVTATMRPKTGGRYAAAIEERDRLLANETRLRGEVTALRDALDKRRLARTRLAELEQKDEQAARHDAIARAEIAYEAAKSHSETLKLAEAEAALLRHRHDGAVAALAGYRTALTSARDLADKLAIARKRRDDALLRRTTANTESDAARLAIEAAEADEREQRDLLARLDAALSASDAAERLAHLRGQLAKAEQAREQVEKGEVALALLTVPAQAVGQLQDIEVELAGLRAAQEVTLPTMRVDYQAGREGSLTVAGAPLAHGQERGFANATQIDIAGIGTLTLRSNRPQQADRGLEQAVARRDAMLVSLGVDNLAAARLRQIEAQERSAALDLARQRLADLAPQGMAQLQADIARLAEASAGDLELKGDAAQVRQAHAAAEQRISTHRNAERELQPVLSQAANGVVEAETALAALVADMTSLEAMLGITADRSVREQAMETAAETAATAYAEAQARVDALAPLAHDLAAAETELRRLRSVDAAAAQEAGQLRVTLADLNGAITARADAAVEENWQETTEALVAAEAALARFKTEVDVLDRLRHSLTTARSAARDLYLKPVVTELRPLLGLLFDDISITFDETTLLPQTVRRNGQDEEIDRLSGGMREQLSILTRLAFAGLLARDGRAAPVILDDALVYSDDDRIERMFNALHQRSRDQQILVFSCRQRAFSRLGGNVLQMQPWTPPFG